MAQRADTTERLQAVELVTDQALLMTADGRPVRAASQYTDAAATMTVDGRPIRAASTDPAVAAEGGPIRVYCLFAAGTLMTADGRPVEALMFFNAAGAPAPIV